MSKLFCWIYKKFSKCNRVKVENARVTPGSVIVAEDIFSQTDIWSYADYSAKIWNYVDYSAKRKCIYKSFDMASCLFEIQNNVWRKFKHTDYDYHPLMDAINDCIEDHNIILEDLIE